MRVQRVEISNVKRFKNAVFEFSKEHNIYTISGKNGSGKTTVIKCLQVFQQLFIHEQLTNRDAILGSDYAANLISTLVDNDNQISTIAIFFKGPSHEGQILLRLENGGYSFSGTPETQELVKGNWNPRDPKNLIIVLDASKSFSDVGVTFDTIELKSREEKYAELIFDTIFHPEEILKNIYRRALLDHVHYRIDPKIDNTYLTVAKELCRMVMPNMEIRDISGTRKHREFVLYGRMNDSDTTYDIRGFSAGEKTLFLSLLFVLYVQSIGILILDELENHFHEELLHKYYNLLVDLVRGEQLNNWLLERIDSFTDAQRKRIFELYANHNIEQVVLFTHSKSLIYNNFSFGKNYVLENGSRELIAEDAERTLRSFGLSTIYQRTLMVEGKDDYSFFNAVLSSDNIKVKPLNSCTEVIDTYKKVQRIKGDLFNSRIVFLVDRDNRPESYWRDLRSIDEEFFDKSFVRLEKHEIENYFIDATLFEDTLNSIQSFLGSDFGFKRHEIQKSFFENSSKHKKKSLQKSLQFSAQQFLNEKIFSTITDFSKRTLDSADFLADVDNIFSNTLKLEFLTTLHSEVQKYEENNWKINWVTLVDGKSLLNEMLHLYSKKVGMSFERFRDYLVRHAEKNHAKYEAGEIVRQIRELFQRE